ncbi:hypothetical protein G210_3358 [Candida maltosa Xu316]|uniref:Uncharacterized protein n=1 Tax=Candida maltosa (strain Xu316) TaxID=1245528 RepID=M3JU48_CANMX|nr:hypothetical protein G210_3358 [Candida maltosa Xu316]
MKTSSIYTALLLASTALAFKVKTTVDEVDLYFSYNTDENQLELTPDSTDDFTVDESDYLIPGSSPENALSDDAEDAVIRGYAIAEGLSTWTLTDTTLAFASPLFACGDEAPYVVTTDGGEANCVALDEFTVEEDENEDASTEAGEDENPTEPADDASETEPADDATETEPAEDASETEPAEDASETEPADEPATTEPADEPSTTEPATTEPTDEPADESGEPADESSEPTEEPTEAPTDAPVPSEDKPFVIKLTFNGEPAWLKKLGNNIGLADSIEDAIEFTIVDGILVVDGTQYIQVGEDGLLIIVDSVEDATPGWQLDDEGVLYFDYPEGISARAISVAVFSVCENEDGEYIVYVGQMAGCEVVTDVEVEEVTTGVVTTTETQEVIITETVCDEQSSCTEITKTIEGFITTVTHEVIVTETVCEEETVCETKAVVRSTTFVTYCPTETKVDDVTVTITSCVEEGTCTEIVTTLEPTDNSLSTDYIVTVEEDSTSTVTKVIYVTVASEAVPPELANAANTMSSKFVAFAAFLLPLFM